MSQDDGMEIQELHEQAEHTHSNPQLMPVSFTMSLLAVLVAITTLIGHRSHTEEVVTQIKASDTWSEYQAKNIRWHTYQSLAEQLSVQSVNDAEKAGKVLQHFRQQAEKYDHEKDDLNKEAHALEREVATEERRAGRFDFAEALLEVALVVTSITLLTRRRLFWYCGMAAGALGLAVAVTGFFVH
ncbi:MAG TPA: DUF4337 domain-containing protein [Terriglobales bacterium]